MGRDKALLPFRGASLIETVAREVQRAAGVSVIVGSHHEVSGFRTIPDLYPGEGPLGGILTALRDSKARWNLVTACDMPEISARFLTSLLEQAERTGAEALIPTGPSGRPEPLCAVYGGICLPAFERAFSGGVRRVTEALESVSAVRFPVTETLCFQNVNTPEDWAGYAAE